MVRIVKKLVRINIGIDYADRRQLMSEDIKNHLDQYIQQELLLLDQISQLRGRGNIGTEIGKTAICEGAAAFATSLFESSLAGRLGRKLTRSALDQQQKNQFLNQQHNIENQHNSLVRGVRDFLSSVSVRRKNLQEANSYQLIEKLDLAQDFLRIDTRIRRTITTLRAITGKQLIYNRDIMSSQTVKEMVIPPGEPYSGSLRLKEILQSVQGYAKIIDPYVDETTLEFLFQIPESLPIKLMTENTGGGEKEKQFKRACQRFKTERSQYQVRKCRPGLIHDRFILTKTQGWSVGSSLKDIGKRLSMINEMSIQSRIEAEKEFDSIWRSSTDLLI